MVSTPVICLSEMAVGRERFLLLKLIVYIARIFSRLSGRGTQDSGIKDATWYDRGQIDIV